MKEAIERVEKYLTEYARFNGNDKECIHTLQAGSDHEASLTVADIELLVGFAKSLAPEKISPLIPDGWKLVPIDPTPAMLAEIHLDPAFTARSLMTRYEAMLSVVPELPERKLLVEPEDKPALPDVEIVKELRKLAANSQSVLFSHRQVLKEAACLIELSYVEIGKVPNMAESIAQIIWTYGINNHFEDSFYSMPVKKQQTALIYAGHVCKFLGERFAEIKRAVDALVYQEIRYVAVSAGPVSSGNNIDVVKEAEKILNQRRKHLNTLLTP